jgi:hypothetical protein
MMIHSDLDSYPTDYGLKNVLVSKNEFKQLMDIPKLVPKMIIDNFLVYYKSVKTY